MANLGHSFKSGLLTATPIMIGIASYAFAAAGTANLATAVTAGIGAFALAAVASTIIAATTSGGYSRYHGLDSSAYLTGFALPFIGTAAIKYGPAFL